MDYCTDDYDDVFLVAGPEEWCKIMDAFKYFCFNVAGFEIFRTAEMGLGCILNLSSVCCVFVTLFSLIYLYVGIHATRRISLALLSTKLAGFLEYVPRAHFRALQRLHYKSLYSFDYEDPEDEATSGFSPSSCRRKTYYFILFGPLALCNSSNDVTYYSLLQLEFV